MTSKVSVTSAATNNKVINVATDNTAHVLQPGDSCEVWVHGTQSYSVSEGDAVSTGPRLPENS